MSASIDTLVNLLFPVRYDDRDSKDAIVDCVKCGKPKLYIHRTTGIAHCFVCDYRARMETLIQLIKGCSFEEAFILASRAKADHAIIVRDQIATGGRPSLYEEMLHRMYADTPSTPDVPTIKLPRGTIPLEKSPGMRYLHRRGFTKRHLQPYKLRYCKEPNREQFFLQGHIIFPDYDAQGRTRYWTSRAAWDGVVDGKKSYNPKGVKRSPILYGEFALKDEQRVFITEGPLDAIAIRGVALLGKTISELQCKAVAAMGRRAFICLDQDETSGAAKVAKRLKDFGVACWMVQLPVKDPAEALKQGMDPRALALASAEPFSFKWELLQRV